MFAPNVTCVVVLNHVWPFMQAPTRYFLLGHIFLLRMTKMRLRYYSLGSKSTNLSLCWNRFLRRTQTNRIKTVTTGRRTLIQASFEFPTMLFKLIPSPARSAQITLLKFNLTRDQCSTQTRLSEKSSCLFSTRRTSRNFVARSVASRPNIFYPEIHEVAGLVASLNTDDFLNV